ncbi:MAG: transcriptional regulator, SarA/Rot family, partial [Bacillota bacterium]
EKSGYIKRKRSKNDERMVYILLTQKGKALKSEAEDVPFKLTKQLFKEGSFNKKMLLEHKAMLDEILKQFN